MGLGGQAMTIFRTFAVTGGLVSALTACDSFRGAQQPIDAPSTMVASAQRFSPDEAIVAFYASDDAARKTLTRRQYRDQVVTLRLLAIDARYQAFVQELRGARAGVGLGADLITLVLGGLGTFVAGDTTKSVLAAGTAVVAGSRASFDKNLFYDQTLPAIVAQMDAERNKQLLVIRTGLSKAEDAYSLPDALFDLSQLERLGSIETAIKRITESATAQAKKTSDDLQTFSVTSSLENQKAILSTDGVKRRAALIQAVDKLDEAKAVQLAIKPPVKNDAMDKAAATMIPADGTISAARARFILKMRLDNIVGGTKELDAWEAAFK